jgi:hypothetical protein
MILAKYNKEINSLCLFNTEDGSLISSYLQVQEASSFEWVDKISGDFVTASTKIGVLKLWNASQ